MAHFLKNNKNNLINVLNFMFYPYCIYLIHKAMFAAPNPSISVLCVNVYLFMDLMQRTLIITHSQLYLTVVLLTAAAVPLLHFYNPTLI